MTKKLIKKWKTLLLTVMCVVSLAYIPGIDAMAEPKELEELAFSEKTAETINVDGKLDESAWGDLPYSVDRRQVSTPLNNTCTFDTRWNDEYLYIAVKVVDAAVIGTGDFLGPNIYDNDGIEILLDANNSKLDDKYDDGIVHFMFQVADGAWDVWGGEDKWSSIKAGRYDNVVVGYDLTADGYTVEAAFPFAALGVTSPAEGTIMGLAVNNNDNDDHTKIDRKELFWNANCSASDPSTWGTVCLYTNKTPMISTAGAVTMDGILNEDYELTAKAKGTDFGFQAGTLCDDKYLYLAVDLELPQGVTSSEFMIFLDGASRHAERRGDKDLDFVFKYTDGLFTQDYFRSISGYNEQEGKYSYSYSVNGVILKVVKSDKGNTLEMAIPWQTLNTEREHLNGIGAEIVLNVNDDSISWNNSHKTSWNSSVGYGTIFLNNLYVGGDKNIAPSGNQLYSYSIPEGGLVRGNVNVTDENAGDVVTYQLAAGSAGADEGDFSINSGTGNWSYKAPSGLIKPEGVNYFVESSDGKGGTFTTRVEIRIEHKPTNLTYHVNGNDGNDSNDGLSKEMALKTVQAAHNKTNPGDTVLIYESEIPYGWSDEYVHDGSVSLTRSGLPEAYITYKAAPGHNPVFKSKEWNTIMVQSSYVILEGLTLDGLGDEVTFEDGYRIYRGKSVSEEHPDYIPGVGVDVSRANTNGINIGPLEKIEEVGISKIKITHHVEVRDCTINNVSACGIGGSVMDYITIENNTITNTCWRDMYGSSGISVLSNVDMDDNYKGHKIIIRNNIVAGNRHFVPWVTIMRYSDGNGIISDSNNNKVTNDKLIAAGDPYGLHPYQGRTLITNNLSYLNGGSGIHAFDSNNVDIINNTVYSNSQTPTLGYSDLFASQANSIRIYNNIVYSRTGVKENPSEVSNEDVEYDHNIFYNYASNDLGISYPGKYGKPGTTAGENNQYATNPLFKNLPQITYPEPVYPDHFTEEMLDFAAKCGYIPGFNYDVRQYDFDFSLQTNSPAWNAADEEWSSCVGNEKRTVGIFDPVGAR